MSERLSHKSGRFWDPKLARVISVLGNIVTEASFMPGLPYAFDLKCAGTAVFPAAPPTRGDPDLEVSSPIGGCNLIVLAPLVVALASLVLQELDGPSVAGLVPNAPELVDLLLTRAGMLALLPGCEPLAAADVYRSLKTLGTT